MNQLEYTALKNMALSSDKESAYLSAIILRKESTEESKKLLYKIPLDIRIKDYSDIIDELKIKELTINDFGFLPENQRIKLFASHKIQNIVDVINEGWVPNFNDSTEKKYYPYFIKRNGVWGFYSSVSHVGDGGSYGPVGLYQTEEKSNFVGKKFLDIYSDYLDIIDELKIKELTINDFGFLPENQRIKLFASHKIQNIVDVINEGWVPNFNDSTERKYYPYFIKKNGVWGFYGSHCRHHSGGSYGIVGLYQTEEKSNFVGKKFLDIYSDYLD